MANDSPDKWYHFQKVRFKRNDIIKRVRRAEKATTKHAHKFLLKRWSNAREVRRVMAIWIGAIGVLIGVAALQVGFDQRAYQANAGGVGGTYAEAVVGTIQTLNPLFATSAAEEAASYLLFSRLLTYDTSGNVNYDLAADVSRNDAGNAYTITLNDGVRWHDGHALTADDVVFTAELIKDPQTRSQIRGWEDMTVEKRDDHTVVFTLPAPYAAFEHALMFPILPKHILGDVERSALREHTFSRSPVGSGPFAFSMVQNINTERTQRIVHLVANEAYYDGLPKLARYQLHTYPDRESVLRALSVNEVNAAIGLSQSDTRSVDTSRYNVATAPVQSGVYAMLNTESSILGDIRVRQALQRATNTTEIRERIGNDIPALDLPFTSSQFDGTLPERKSFDVKAANAILDKAGWKMENGVRKKGNNELRLSVVTTRDVGFERALEALIGQWRQIGVAVDERIVDASDPAQSFAQTVLQSRNYDVLLYQLAIGRDPDVYAYWHSSQATALGLNLSNYNSAVSDDILSTARVGLDPSLRTAKYESFARQWLEDVPAIGLYQSTIQYVSSKSVSNDIANIVLNSPQDRFSNVLYWTAGERTVYKTP